MTRVHGSLARYKNGPDEHGTLGKGCRCQDCREANNAWQRNQYRMTAYGQWEPMVHAAGTRRRVQALVWNGWSLTLLAGRLGYSRQALTDKLGYGKVTVATAEAVRGLYRELLGQPPPQRDRAERQSAAMARRYARERGWVAGLAWDAIDDPDASPVRGWQREDDCNAA